MTIEFTNNHCENANIVDNFVRALINDASRKLPEKRWIRVPAKDRNDFDGFSLPDEHGCTTVLRVDSCDSNHMQLSLRYLSPDGQQIFASTEWSTNQSNDNLLLSLYSMLDAAIPSEQIDDEETCLKNCIPLMEQLISCLATDAASIHSVSWEVHAGEDHLPTFSARGCEETGAQFWIVPEEIGKSCDQFKFLYQLDGVEVLSTTQRASAKTHSPLRNLYHAILGNKIAQSEISPATEEQQPLLHNLLLSAN